MPNAIKIEKMVFPAECAKMLDCAVGVVSAVKKMLGIERKKVFPSEIEKFLKDNPSFKVTDVYKKAA